MAYNFRRAERDQPFLLPPDLRDWLPEGHLAWFILDVVDQLDLASFYRQHRDDGHGHPAYNPKLLLGVLLYGYCKVLDLLGAAGRLDWSGANVDSMSVRAKRRSYRRQVALV